MTAARAGPQGEEGGGWGCCARRLRGNPKLFVILSLVTLCFWTAAPPLCALQRKEGVLTFEPKQKLEMLHFHNALHRSMPETCFFFRVEDRHDAH